MSREARSVRTRNNRHGLGGLLRGAAASLIAILLIALAASPAMAAKGGRWKVSQDLRDKINNGSPSDMIRLVVSLSGGADPLFVTNRVESLGGKVRKHFKNVDEMSIVLPLGSVASLTDLDGLDYIAYDRDVAGMSSHLETTTGASLVSGSTGGTLQSLLSTLDGTGVGVAVLDSGIDGEHNDLKDELRLKRRVVLSMDFTGRGSLDDPYGHGTHIAGTIAGDGSASAQVGRDYTGLAPNANLINFKVLDEYGRGSISNVVAAIDQAISLRSYFNIKVINLSLAAPPIDSYVNDPMCKAVERATKAGIVVVAASGNFGLDSNGSGNKVYGGITSPGISPFAITVGATNTYGTDIRSDDTVAPYSSRGPTMSHTTDPMTGQVAYDNLAKPDLVAPGTRVVAAERSGNLLVTYYPALHVDTGNVSNRSRYMTMSGSSMATAVVSGAVALMMQANPGLNPSQVKAILMYSAQIMDGPDLFGQGAGMLDVQGAVRLAESVSRVPYALAVGATLLPDGVLPGQPQTTVAGETFAWGQAVIWGGGMLRGEAILTTQQTAYAQSLIWGIGRVGWGVGVTYYDGLYSDTYVAFGKNNQWNYITWNSGTPLASGLIWSERLYASGVVWQNQLISNDFFDVSSTSLIWGYRSYDSGLIWGLRDAGLIWGLNNAW